LNTKHVGPTVQREPRDAALVVAEDAPGPAVGQDLAPIEVELVLVVAPDAQLHAGALFVTLQVAHGVADGELRLLLQQAVEIEKIVAGISSSVAATQIRASCSCAVTMRRPFGKKAMRMGVLSP
jgi:hypothetical protein